MDSPPSVLDSVITHLETTSAIQFVDFGCGRGAALARVAQRFPDLECVGVDLDSDALRYASERFKAAGIKNVRLVEGDVLDCVDLAQDVAYLYLGGALNQRLGLHLLEAAACRQVLAVRYPIIGAVASGRILTGGPSMVHTYDVAHKGQLVEWDFPGTELSLPSGSLYLLGRAIRVTTASILGLAVAAQPQGASVQSAEFGLCPARPGVPTICDMLVKGGSPANPPSVLRVSVLAGDAVLEPSHYILVRTNVDGEPAERPILEIGPLVATQAAMVEMQVL